MIRIFDVSIPVRGVVLFCAEIVLLVLSFLLAQYLVGVGDVLLFFRYELRPAHTLTIAFGMLWTAYMLDMYSNVLEDSVVIVLQQMMVRSGMVFLLEAGLSFLHVGGHIPLQLLFTGCIITTVAITTCRVVCARTIFPKIGLQNVILVGSHPLIYSIAEHIQEHPELGLRLLGYISDSCEPPQSEPCKYLGQLDQLRDIIFSTTADRIIVGMKERRGRLPIAALLEVRLAGYLVEEAAMAYERLRHRVSVMTLIPSQLVFSGRFGQHQKNYIFHALLDIGGATLGTLIFSPVMLAIAIAIKLTSRGPIFYHQRRIGLNGKPFDVLKFRTMDENPDDPSNPIPTRLGNLLRKLRVNELPQLINVLRGEMSIVGPRPERPEYVRVFCEKIPYYMQRHSVRPGITGWAQINYLHGDTVEDTITKLEYDLYYIKYLSHPLDFFIIFHTIKIVLLSRGAG